MKQTGIGVVWLGLRELVDACIRSGLVSVFGQIKRTLGAKLAMR